MIDIKRFEQIKRDLEAKQREQDEARGALTQITRQIKEEFGCENLEVADKKLKELEKEERELERRYEDELEAFEKKWQNVVRS